MLLSKRMRPTWLPAVLSLPLVLAACSGPAATAGLAGR